MLAAELLLDAQTKCRITLKVDGKKDTVNFLVPIVCELENRRATHHHLREADDC